MATNAERCPVCGGELKAWINPSGREDGWDCQGECGKYFHESDLALARRTAAVRVAEAVDPWREFVDCIENDARNVGKSHFHARYIRTLFAGLANRCRVLLDSRKEE